MLYTIKQPPVPRRRGDEPNGEVRLNEKMLCSPQARG